MEKKLQDKAWACLPKEIRTQIKNRYEKSVNMGLRITFDIIFGHHNLISDAEPEEMLMVPRRGVQIIYKDKMREKGHHAVSQSKKDMATGWINAMRFFFSKEKCLPDKELNEDNFAKSHKEEQPKPKFKVGDKVRVVSKPLSEYSITGEITYFNESNGLYTIDNQWGFLESELEPYTE